MPSFKQHDLPQQFAQWLKQELLQGAWAEKLPCERELCHIGGVSRRTLRAALTILRTDGWLKTGARRGSRIVLPKGASLATKKRRVIIIAHSPIGSRGSLNWSFVWLLQRRLLSLDYDVQIDFAPQRGLDDWLENYVPKRDSHTFALASVKKEIQAWFAARAFKAIVMGSCFPGVRLPSLEIDYRAVCRHAASLLLRLGHKRLLFLNTAGAYAGDLAGEEGFGEAMRMVSAAGAHYTILRHAGNTRDIRRLLVGTFKQPQRPTALLVTNGCFALCAAGILADLGLRIPGQVSLICRDDDDMLKYYLPEIAHYAVREEALIRQSVAMFVRLNENKNIPSKTIVPELVMGGSVRSLAP
ncbi:MAG: substrate-binding domain-containing protein [Kiritimatiellaeota bacterium]|nr:substrate-binding domain-containing protein [Kiritimatiellota bacterium]